MNRPAKQRQSNSTQKPTVQIRSVANKAGLNSDTRPGSLKFKDNRPETANHKLVKQLCLQNLSQGSNNTGKVAQMIFHTGTTTKSTEYTSAGHIKKKKADGSNYSKEEIQRFIDSKKHYSYNKTTQTIERIRSKTKKKSSTKKELPTELTGWIKEVDSGMNLYNKQSGDKSVFNYKPRELFDNKKGGSNVGVNNIANLDFLKQTKNVDLDLDQKKLVYLSNFLKSPDTYMDEEYSDDEDLKKERAKVKKKIGPEIQFLIGSDDFEKYLYMGGNSGESQKLLKHELLGKRKVSNKKKRKRNSEGDDKPKFEKKRKIESYYEETYRNDNIEYAINQMERFINTNNLGGWLTDLINTGTDNNQIRKALKKKIGNGYKNERLNKMFTLKHALKNTYFKDAKLVIPDNLKDIHAESNLLDEATEKLNKIYMVIGSKVPCVACFAKFCESNNASHLLQYTSSIWFSKPCMTQLGCDYGKQSPSEVLKYLNTIDLQIRSSIKQLKKLTKKDLQMYTGNKGNLKNSYFDDESSSEGEESRQQLIERFRGKKRKKKTLKRIKKI